VRKSSISRTISKNKSRKTMPGMKAMKAMKAMSGMKAAPLMVPSMKHGGHAKKPKVGIAIMIAMGKKGKK